MLCKRMSALLLVMLAFCLYPFGIFAEVYQASGIVKYSIGKDRVERFSRNFDLAVSNCDWSVRIDAKDVEAVDYYDVVHRDNSIFSYRRLNRPNDAKYLNSGIATIEAGDVPIEDGTFANYIWIGFASSCYFRELSSDQVRPLWATRGESNKVTIQFDLLDKTPFLPDKIVYRENPNPKRSPPFERGWKTAEMRVLARTNVGDLMIPLEYEFERFRPLISPLNSGELESLVQIMVSVRAVRLHPATAIVPVATEGITLVQEKRLSPVPGLSGIVYASSNAVLPAVPERQSISLHATMSQAASMSKTGKTPEKGRPKVVAALLITLAVGPLVVFSIRRWSRTQKR
jgi:hypothetical protein